MTGENIGSGVRTIETLWIPLSDGARLAARVWMPDDADKRPVPAILQFLPYRRRDRHRRADALHIAGYATRGYASVVVDNRGSGDSDGVMSDEYTPQEWFDAAEAIAWIAAQSWCSGNVGLIGISWGGFNSLQIAALRPPALKAIVTAASSDNRFADDMHYMGGCLLNDNLNYGSTLFTWLGTPPDPLIVGDRWREMWKERLEAVYPPTLRWMKHQTFDDYWKSGSVSTDYSRIGVPVMAVAGWADGYSNSVLRLLNNIDVPRKGLIGPWGHTFPHLGRPGPAIDFLSHVTRWWDHWLKDIDSGLMDEPMLTVWMQESELPRPAYQERKGYWVSERNWPSSNVSGREFTLTPGRLISGSTESSNPIATVSSPVDLGTASGEWSPYGAGPDMPLDQRLEDGGSAVFDSFPLSENLQLLGGCLCRLRLRATDKEAMVAIRLNDVSPDGTSRRITYGLLNLSLRDGMEKASAYSAQDMLSISVKLQDVAYEVPQGNILRLAISTSYWPLAMGTPHRIQVTVEAGTLTLPVRKENLRDAPDLGEADVPPCPEIEIASPLARGRMSIRKDLEKCETIADMVRSVGEYRINDVGIRLQGTGTETYVMPWNNPEKATSHSRRNLTFERGEWLCEVRSTSTVSFQDECFLFDGTLQAYEGGKRIFNRRWVEKVPRLAAIAEESTEELRSEKK